MTKRRIIVLVISIFTLLILFSLVIGKGRGSSKDYECSIIFPLEIINVAGSSGEEFGESLKKAADQKADYKINEDGSVSFYIDRKDKDELIGFERQMLENLKNQFEAIDENYYMNFSDDYKSLDIAYSRDLNHSDAIGFVMYADMLCGICQILNEESSEWDIYISIYNSDTGNMVKSGNTKDGSLEYTDEDWGE